MTVNTLTEEIFQLHLKVDSHHPVAGQEAGSPARGLITKGSAKLEAKEMILQSHDEIS